MAFVHWEYLNFPVVYLETVAIGKNMGYHIR